jgi:predicted metalloprotease
MKYRKSARLDTSQVRDTRRVGGRGAAIGGGGVGIVGVLIYLVVSAVGGSGAGQAAATILGELGQSGQPATADNSQVAAECKTGADANTKLECAVVADIDSIQAYWSRELPKLGRPYVAVPTVWFSGQVSTGCDAADSGAGPFYCPADKRVYIDLSFYDDIKSEFRARGGLFVDAYVLAHEYGHHVQDLLGIESKVRTRQDATSDSVRLELQADCFAGVCGQTRDGAGTERRTGTRRIDQPAGLRERAPSSGPDRRRLDPEEPRKRPGQPAHLHARQRCAAGEVADDRLPHRRPASVRHACDERPGLSKQWRATARA